MHLSFQEGLNGVGKQVAPSTILGDLQQGAVKLLCKNGSHAGHTESTLTASHTSPGSALDTVDGTRADRSADRGADFRLSHNFAAANQIAVGRICCNGCRIT